MKRSLATCGMAVAVTLLAATAWSAPVDPLAGILATSSIAAPQLAAKPLTCGFTCQQTGPTPPYTASGTSCADAEGSVAAQTRAYADAWCQANVDPSSVPCIVNTVYDICSSDDSDFEVTGAAIFSCKKTSC